MEPRWLDINGVAAHLSISKGTALRLVEDGKLPPPVRLTPRCPRWDREAVDNALTTAAGFAPVMDQDVLAERVINGFAQRRSRRQGRR